MILNSSVTLYDENDNEKVYDVEYDYWPGTPAPRPVNERTYLIPPTPDELEILKVYTYETGERVEVEDFSDIEDVLMENLFDIAYEEYLEQRGDF